MKDLFKEDLQVINVGLTSFGEVVAREGGTVLQIEWSPPGQGNREIGKKLAKLVNLPEVEKANQRAFKNYLAAQPILESVGAAKAVIPNMGERMILHAGPPVSWEEMCGPMRGAITGAILLEGWAKDLDEASELAASNEITYEPNHHHAAVGPMSGVTSPSMPVWIVSNSTHGNKAFCSLNEGLGKVLRMGANSPDVIDRLKWMGKDLAPILKSTLDRLGGLELKPMIAQALQMGDEVHNRNAAASSLLLKRLVPVMVKTDIPLDQIAAAVEFIAGNDHFFLNISMAACKAMLDAAHNQPGSSMVTAMARNGVEFGIRVSGTGDSWFTAPAPKVNGLYFPGYSIEDAAPDLGDSAITETAGLGGFAMATAPAIVKFVGGSVQDAFAYTREMTQITLGLNNALSLPVMDFSGTPAGIDIRKSVDTGIAPIINTGIAHHKAGIGQIGAGITRAPMACLAQAVVALADRLH
ncbi:MAG: DUF1116 domain-containing protein [Deltaproteobacteria bacterium]|nr:DUF1116 domain-containing protein [Deltaproteobacteria bacterium]